MTYGRTTGLDSCCGDGECVDCKLRGGCWPDADAPRGRVCDQWERDPSVTREKGPPKYGWRFWPDGKLRWTRLH